MEAERGGQGISESANTHTHRRTWVAWQSCLNHSEITWVYQQHSAFIKRGRWNNCAPYPRAGARLPIDSAIGACLFPHIHIPQHPTETDETNNRACALETGTTHSTHSAQTTSPPRTCTGHVSREYQLTQPPQWLTGEACHDLVKLVAVPTNALRCDRWRGSGRRRDGRMLLIGGAVDNDSFQLKRYNSISIYCNQIPQGQGIKVYLRTITYVQRKR